MGLSTKKKKETVTPIVNEPMASNLNSYASMIPNAILNKDPYSLVAPASDLQQQAFAQAPQLGSAWQPAAQQALNTVQNVSNAPAATYQAPQLGSANLAQGARLGQATLANAPTIEPTQNAQAQSLLTNFDAYKDPYINDVVKSALANYDHYSGQQAAALRAQQAGSTAFRGSRSGIALGEYEANRERQRSDAEYGMRSDAHRFATQAAGQDADRRQGANLFNANAFNQRALAQGQINATNSMFNAGAQNQFASQQADLNQQASMFNAGAQNQFALTQGGMDADAARYNAQAQAEAYQRALQAAGITAGISNSMGANQRADLALTADLGNQQRMIGQEYLNAPYNQLLQGGQLYGLIPTSSYIGKNTLTKSTPSTFAQILAAAQTAAAFV